MYNKENELVSNIKLSNTDTLKLFKLHQRRGSSVYCFSHFIITQVTDRTKLHPGT